jgi:hypothetical protein
MRRTLSLRLRLAILVAGTVLPLIGFAEPTRRRYASRVVALTGFAIFRREMFKGGAHA